MLAERRRHEILEPSLRRDAEAWLESARPAGRTFEGKPLVEIQKWAHGSAEYVSPDGKETRSASAEVRQARVRETIMTYRVADLPVIVATGDQSSPFEGTAGIEVTVQTRQVADVEFDVPDGVPADWQRASKMTLSRIGIGGWRNPGPGLPVPFDPGPLTADLPDSARKQIAEAILQCARQPQRTERWIYLAKFRYSASSRAWLPTGVPVKE